MRVKSVYEENKQIKTLSGFLLVIIVPLVKQKHNDGSRDQRPLDVLIMVFEKLGPGDLMNCLYVSTYWRDAVNYFGTHYGKWQELAQAAMVNRGMPLRRRSLLGWRDLYINYCLWWHVRDAKLTWRYELEEEDVRNMHVYKDILIVERGTSFYKKCFHIKDKLEDITQKLIDISLDDSSPSSDTEKRLNASYEEYSYETDKMIKMLVQETPFKRLVVIDEDCYYILNEKNILRCIKWDHVQKRWSSFVLARYYGCNRSISDISVYQDEVFMLLKTGLVFRLDKNGRNFVHDRRFTHMTPAQYEFSRMLHGDVITAIERIDTLNIPEYNTGKSVMFQRINAVVAVPLEKDFKMHVEEQSGNMVLEYPGLSCAMQHGQLIFLGFKNGKIEIGITDKFTKNGGASEISVNVQDFELFRGEDPCIVALEVYEAEDSQHLFVATQSHIYRLVITYPESALEAIGIRKDF